MKQFPTTKTESFRSRKIRWALTFWPCVWCSGGKVQFIAGDFKEIHISIKRNIRTWNRFATVYGGSIYSSIDPFYTLMLFEILGKDYVVWDKGASIKFVRPIIDKVKCRMEVDDATLETIRQKVKEQGEYTFELTPRYEDDKGTVYALFTKTIYVASKEFYKNKLAGKKRN